ncbi:MAG: hypothetical protein ABIE74_05115 [Pseudomonadota bacterium]
MPCDIYTADMKKKEDKKNKKTKRGAKVKKPEFSSQNHLATLEYIESSWPGEMPHEINSAFHSIRNTLMELSAGQTPNKEKSSTKGDFVDVLSTIKKMLTKYDMSFLSRQIRYHFAASSSLLPAFIDEDRLEKAISNLLKYLATNSTMGGRISIVASEVAFRTGKAVQLDFHADDELLKSETGASLISRLYEHEGVPAELELIDTVRNILLKEGGQMWIEKLRSGRISYRIILPTDKKLAKHDAPESSFRFDISICDFNLKRKYMGIGKSKALVHQIENFIKSLVRYPMDIVISQDEEGLISTIYEAQKGHASSVSNRISRSLSKEVFRVGKKPVELKFKYKLTPLHKIK